MPPAEVVNEFAVKPTILDADIRFPQPCATREGGGLGRAGPPVPVRHEGWLRCPVHDPRPRPSIYDAERVQHDRHDHSPKRIARRLWSEIIPAGTPTVGQMCTPAG